MAPAVKRRRTSGPQTASKSSQQSQLSFRSTKAGRKQTQTKDEKPAKAEKVEEVQEALVVAEIANDEPEAEADAPEAVPDEVADEKDEDQESVDRQALAMPETKLKSYWSAKERERKAPRVHQQDLSMREKILREFDMSSRFGPSVGIQRIARWRRAHDLGMDPPMEVLAVLLKEEKPSGKKSLSTKRDIQTSIIDELSWSSRGRGEALIEA